MSPCILLGMDFTVCVILQVFIPELGMHFVVKKSSRIFACQNPLHQGGGRKGLPKSFTNRFTQVYIDKLSPADLLHICTQVFPEFSREMLERMITFTFEVCLFIHTDSKSIIIRREECCTTGSSAQNLCTK